MSMRDRGVSTETEPAPGVEGPLQRWARRRRKVAREEEAAAEARREDRKDESAQAPDVRELDGEAPEAVAVEEKVLADADMPPLESLHEDSDYSGFLSPGVSEGLRRRALRKLFMSAVFNVRDGLDDYDDDFTSFEPLGDVVTSDMKHQVEMEAERARRARADAARGATSEDAAGEAGADRDAPAGDEAVGAVDGEVPGAAGGKPASTTDGKVMETPAGDAVGVASGETAGTAGDDMVSAATDEAVDPDDLPRMHALSGPPAPTREAPPRTDET